MVLTLTSKWGRIEPEIQIWWLWSFIQSYWAVPSSAVATKRCAQAWYRPLDMVANCGTALEHNPSSFTAARPRVKTTLSSPSPPSHLHSKALVSMSRVCGPIPGLTSWCPILSYIYNETHKYPILWWRRKQQLYVCRLLANTINLQFTFDPTPIICRLGPTFFYN